MLPTAGTAGGVVRVHPDGILGETAAAGGIHNAGRINAGTFRGDLTNAGEFETDWSMFYETRGSVDGDFIQTPDGILRETVRKAQPTAPLTLANGDIDLAGTIVITPLDPFDVRVNDRFYLVEAHNPIDFSASLQSTGFTFEPQLVPGEGLYAVATAVPEPAHAVAVLAAFGLFLRRRGLPR